MRTKLVLIPAAAVLAAAGAAATSQATVGGPPPSEDPFATIEIPTPLEDWCGFMALAFGPEGAVATVADAVAASLAAGEATAELAYAAQLGGIPPEVEGDAAVLLAAVEALVTGAPVDDPAAVGAAAQSMDAFRTDACDA